VSQPCPYEHANIRTCVPCALGSAVSAVCQMCPPHVEGTREALEVSRIERHEFSFVEHVVISQGLGEGTLVTLIHSGLEPKALKVISQLRPELQLLPILDLGLAESLIADPVWLRYQTTLAAMNIMREESPQLQTFAMVKFEELYVARDPLALTALLDSTFDLFVSPHIEPAMYLTHTMAEKCFPPPIVVAASGHGYSTGFVGGPAEHMQSLLEQVLAMAPKMLSDGGCVSPSPNLSLTSQPRNHYPNRIHSREMGGGGVQHMRGDGAERVVVGPYNCARRDSQRAAVHGARQNAIAGAASAAHHPVAHLLGGAAHGGAALVGHDGVRRPRRARQAGVLPALLALSWLATRVAKTTA